MTERGTRNPNVRPAQYQQQLTLLEEFGLIRRTTPGLPSLHNPEYSYGRPTPAEHVGASRAMYEWAPHRAPPVPAPPRDFTWVNKKAVADGIHTPRETSKYRKEVPNRRVPPADVAKSRSRPIPSDVDSDFVYGRPTSGASNMDLLMTNHYQREWVEALSEKNLQEEMKAAYEAEYIRSINKTTRAAMGHHQLPPPPKPAPFQIKRFGSVPPRVQRTRPAAVMEDVQGTTPR